MNITAKITGIRYTPFLHSRLNTYDIKDLDKALNKSSFKLKINKENEMAVSKWVSPKRTRSYPYARVYNTYGYSGKKITIIPFVKDEGINGDRDFIQWDTISLMSLLDVYVIIAYYDKAKKSTASEGKITNQQFDSNYIQMKIEELLSYRSSALHWNMEQIKEIKEIAKHTINAYDRISKQLNVKLHSPKKIEGIIKKIEKEGEQFFMERSRALALKAQKREVQTTHFRESLESGKKCTLTIKNYLGGYYYFTADEAWLEGDKIYLVEAKNTTKDYMPSNLDIKDALITMVLFTNLKDVKVNNKIYRPIPKIKLTSSKGFDFNKLTKSQKEVLRKLQLEANENNFELEIR